MPSLPRLVSLFVVAASALVAALPVAIRPLADDPSCTDLDRRFMLRAYELSAAASGRGNGCYGALLVRNGEVLMEFSNDSITSGDITHHAETGLISFASRKFGLAVLAESTLYTSTEPCIMCCGAIRFAGIKSFVYGVTARQVTHLRTGRAPENPLECREVFARALLTDTQIRGPLMEAEGLALHAVHFARTSTSR